MSVNLVRCDGKPLLLDFAAHFCPDWVCLSDLHEALGDRGLKDPSDGFSTADLQGLARNFYFSRGHVVFLAGDGAPRNRTYDTRFSEAYNVFAISYDDFTKAVPQGALTLRRLRLLD